MNSEKLVVRAFPLIQVTEHSNESYEIVFDLVEGLVTNISIYYVFRNFHLELNVSKFKLVCVWFFILKEDYQQYRNIEGFIHIENHSAVVRKESFENSSLGSWEGGGGFRQRELAHIGDFRRLLNAQSIALFSSLAHQTEVNNPLVGASFTPITNQDVVVCSSVSKNAPINDLKGN